MCGLQIIICILLLGSRRSKHLWTAGAWLELGFQFFPQEKTLCVPVQRVPCPPGCRISAMNIVRGIVGEQRGRDKLVPWKKKMSVEEGWILTARLEITPSHPGPGNEEPGGVCRAVEFTACFYICWEGCGQISAAWSCSGFMFCTSDRPEGPWTEASLCPDLLKQLLQYPLPTAFP